MQLRSLKAFHLSALYGAMPLLLVVVMALNFGYPLTQYAGRLGDIIFAVCYGLMFVVGMLVTSDSRKHFVQISIAATFWVIATAASFLRPNAITLPLGQFAIVPCQFLIVRELFRFIFRARTVNINVLLASIIIYVLMASIFVPLYAVIERLDPGSIVDHSLNKPVAWQQLMYFSFITMTTAGYGDVLPVNPWARAIASLEAMTGVLYIAILVGRLVGTYSQERQGGAQPPKN